jgi:glycosyltransferase involved in cell wall biosynthesis
MARARVLVVQPSLQPPGGGNAVAAWMIQALVKRHDVSVLTWRPIELDSVNAYYGTAIETGDIRAFEVPQAMRRSIDTLPTPVVLLKASIVFREAKRMLHDYDVVVCGHNETDFGPRCVQYIHYPSRLRPRPDVDLRWYHRWKAPLDAYYVGCDRLMAFARERVTEAVTLTNSSWTASLMTRLYGERLAPRVVHPPVVPPSKGESWSGRQNGFVCIGRIAPEKELERVIGIVAKVRRQIPDAHLHIIGSRGPAWYGRRVRRLADSHPGLVEIHEDVSRADLLRLIATHRYGIHGMREEHFGIAPAEAAAGGCIVFVPNGGGQVDIVGGEATLRYDSEEDAVAKIVAVMTSESEQRLMRAHLADQTLGFSTDRFMDRIRAVVDEIAQPAAGVQ